MGWLGSCGEHQTNPWHLRLSVKSLSAHYQKRSVNENMVEGQSSTNGLVQPAFIGRTVESCGLFGELEVLSFANWTEVGGESGRRTGHRERKFSA